MKNYLYTPGEPADFARLLVELREHRRAESRLYTDYILGQPSAIEKVNAYSEARREFEKTGHDLETEDYDRIYEDFAKSDFIRRILNLENPLAASRRPPPATLSDFDFARRARTMAADAATRRMRWPNLGKRLLQRAPKFAWVSALTLAIPLVTAVSVHAAWFALFGDAELAYVTAVRQSAVVTRPRAFFGMWSIGVGYVAFALTVIQFLTWVLNQSAGAGRKAIVSLSIAIIGVAGGWVLGPLHATAHAVITTSLPVETHNGVEATMDWTDRRPRAVVEITGTWLPQTNEGEPALCALQEVSWFGRRIRGRLYWPLCESLDNVLHVDQRAFAINRGYHEVQAERELAPRPAANP